MSPNSSCHDGTRAPQSFRGCSGHEEWDPVCPELAAYPREENPGEREAGKKSIGKMPWSEIKHSVGHSMGKNGERPREKERQPIHYLFKLITPRKHCFPNPKFPIPSFS